MNAKSKAAGINFTAWWQQSKRKRTGVAAVHPRGAQLTFGIMILSKSLVKIFIAPIKSNAYLFHTQLFTVIFSEMFMQTNFNT